MEPDQKKQFEILADIVKKSLDNVKLEHRINELSQILVGQTKLICAIVNNLPSELTKKIVVEAGLEEAFEENPIH